LNPDEAFIVNVAALGLTLLPYTQSFPPSPIEQQYQTSDCSGPQENEEVAAQRVGQRGNEEVASWQSTQKQRRWQTHRQASEVRAAQT